MEQSIFKRFNEHITAVSEIIGSSPEWIEPSDHNCLLCLSFHDVPPSVLEHVEKIRGTDTPFDQGITRAGKWTGYIIYKYKGWYIVDGIFRNMDGEYLYIVAVYKYKD